MITIGVLDAGQSAVPIGLGHWWILVLLGGPALAVAAVIYLATRLHRRPSLTSAGQDSAAQRSAAQERAGTETLTKAGFWIRTGAYLADVLIVTLVLNIVASLIGADQNLRSLLNLLIGMAYFVYFWSKAGGGQTLGMRLLSLRVMKTDGSMLDYTGAFIRFIGLLVSLVVILLGVIWVAFDPNKQGWHDKLAGTYVIRGSRAARPVPSPPL